VDHGRVIATFAHRRVREVSPTGGAASLAESIAPEQRLLRPAIELIESLNWHGVAMVEIKDPGPERPPVLMEINPRLWGSLPLALAAGVDFPRLLAELFLNRPLTPPQTYRIGVRCRHLRGDLSHLTGVLKGIPRNWPGDFPSRLGTVAGLLPLPGRWRPYTFRLTDPAPGFVEAWDYVTSEFHNIRRNITRPAALRVNVP
jgi:predicted ATP-grasp superfamily ATP-dependent carboligase